jgi:hypothetical protein
MSFTDPCRTSTMSRKKCTRTSTCRERSRFVGFSLTRIQDALSARIGSGGGDARAKAKHLAVGAVDYVCLLSDSVNLFPDTGHIRGGDHVTRNWGSPNSNTHFAARAGQAEKAALQALMFNLTLDDKEIGQLKITVPVSARPGDLVRFTWPRNNGREYDVVVPDGAFAGMQFMTDVPPPSESFTQQNGSQMLAETGDTLHGLTASGFLTKDALSVLGVDRSSFYCSYRNKT